MKRRTRFRGDLQVDGSVVDKEGNPIGGGVPGLLEAGFAEVPDSVHNNADDAGFTYDENGFSEIGWEIRRWGNFLAVSLNGRYDASDLNAYDWYDKTILGVPESWLPYVPAWQTAPFAVITGKLEQKHATDPGIKSTCRCWFGFNDEGLRIVTDEANLVDVASGDYLYFQADLGAIIVLPLGAS